MRIRPTRIRRKEEEEEEAVFILDSVTNEEEAVFIRDSVTKRRRRRRGRRRLSSFGIRSQMRIRPTRIRHNTDPDQGCDECVASVHA